MDSERLEKLSWTSDKRTIIDLKGFDINPRKVNEQKQAQLINSLNEFNQVDILVINLDNTIISGHRRVEALLAIGDVNTTVDVRVPNRLLTEEEVKRYNLIANTHAGEWDLDLLNEHFADINYQDIIGGIECNLEELPSADIISRKEEQQELIDDEFDEAVPDVAITQTQDLYELGVHRLYCADSTNADAVSRLMNGKKAAMIFTDPPYNVKVNSIGSSGKIKHQEFAMASGEMSEAEFTNFLKTIFKNQIEFSTDGSIHFICMDWKHIHEMTTAGKVFSELKNLIVWNKNCAGMGSFYRSKHELIFVFKNGTKKHINNFLLGETGRFRTNVWDYIGFNSTHGAERAEIQDHPTPKPVKMVGDAIIDCSNDSDIILDLFIGSGTTIIAAEQTKRICYGQELSPKFCDLTVRRYIRFMKQLGRPVSIKKNGVTLSKSELKEFDK